MNDASANKRLGDFIRAHRERQPAPPNAASRRRTPGLRREELADAAGISATWLTWLEQGREVKASVPALVRLSNALRLTPAERARSSIAGKRDPDETVPDETDLPAELLALPSGFSGPAYLLDHLWTARAWNEAAAISLPVGSMRKPTSATCSPSSSSRPRHERSSAAGRTAPADWPRNSRRFQPPSRRRRDGRLVADLKAKSPEFARLWKAQTVLGREGGERDFNHPALGALSYHQTTLLIAARRM